MIGKIVTGKSFGGAVRYLLGKEPGKAYILTSDGVELTSRQALIGSFEFQRRARPDVERVVGHISLSFHPDDDPRMSNQLMLDLAREYMQRMEITGTQYLVVRHTDTKHPHLHILYNRVRYDTTLVPDRNERLRNMRICRELKQEYGLTFSHGKEQVARNGCTVRNNCATVFTTTCGRCCPSVPPGRHSQKNWPNDRSPRPLFIGAAIRRRRSRA